MTPRPRNPPGPSDPGRRGLGWVIGQSVLMTAVIVSGPIRSNDAFTPLVVASGCLLLVLAAAIGITGVIQLGDNRTPFPDPRPDSRLIRHGIYARCRHPLYTSVLLAGLAWALLWQNHTTLLLALLQFPFFLAKARHEERLLRARFPEYESYARQVKRFLPGIY